MRATRRRVNLRAIAGTLASVLAAAGMLGVASVASPTAAAAAVTCGAATIQYAYDGSCASYGGVFGWFGSYGPGFPTSNGWVLGADAASVGAPAPDPTTGYSAGSAPAGASSADFSALGFAFSESQATDGWLGGGTYSSNDEATAAQLLYDDTVWGATPPSMTGGVLTAYNALDAWYVAAVGATASPTIDMNTSGAGPIPTAGELYGVRLTFPGTGNAAGGFPVTLTLSGGYFPGGTTTDVLTTDSAGNATVEVYADSASTDVDVTASATVGSLGLKFYDSASGGQPVVGFAPPATASNSDIVPASIAEPGAGTISIDEGGDDVAYFGLAGGVYQVIDAGQNVVATLTTDSAGAAGPSQPLPLGTYTVHEETAPPGYSASPDQTVTVVDGGNVTAHFTGPFANLAMPATLTITDSDAETSASLGGATFNVFYDPNNSGTFTQSVGSCTSDAGGQCSPPPNDQGELIPGTYLIQEVGAAPGYYSGAGQQKSITIGPSSGTSVSFDDALLGSLSLTKAGNDASYYAIAGAIFRVTGPNPSSGYAGTLTVTSNGTSNTVTGLQPGAYTLTETRPPTGYRAVTPFNVSVSLGHATTQVNVVDAIEPSSLDIYNQEQGNSSPIVGGVFDVHYDAGNADVYSQDLGNCTTSSIGACSPPGSLSGLLPGRYEVTEVAAPPGYAIDPTKPTRDIVLTPFGLGVLDFQDPRLVPASFAKTPTGNFNPQTDVLAGAVFDVAAGSPGGSTIASCTTDASGACTTPADFIAGDNYCWQEVKSPPGFESGENGCFVAGNSISPAPIVVDEPGEYVEVDAKKVDAAATGQTLPGALLDLYRMDDAAGPTGPPVPAGTPQLAGGTWVASGTTDANGAVRFPLQLPGYAYCVVEASPPAGYELDRTPRCTGILAGSASVPAASTTVVVPDTAVPPPEVTANVTPPSPPTVGATPTITLTAHKYDALAPSSSIAGAVYDLYIVGPEPPADAGLSEPADPTPAGLPGDSWVARATTDASGNLRFTLPSGYAWCLKEAVAPPDFVFDPMPHCTDVLTPTSAVGAAAIELPEKPVMVDIQAHKYNSLEPNTGIPGAAYDVYAMGPSAPGAVAAPSGTAPAPVGGDTFYERGVTGRGGNLVVAVPAGFAWCLKEAHAPPAYRFDPGLHCTAVLEPGRVGTLQRIHLALAEMPKHVPPAQPQLPFTGFGIIPALVTGGALGSAGAVLLVLDRRRTRRTTSR